MPTLVPAEDFPNAVSLGILVFHVATIGGPAIAGFMLAESGPAVIYAINAFSFVAVIAALLLMQASGKPDLQSDRRSALSVTALKEGLRFVWHTPIIVQTMTLDFLATFFGSATLLLPIFAQERLNVGARGYGFLAAAPAIGSVLTALVMARMGSFRRQGRLVVWSVAVFGVATAAFGVSTVLLVFFTDACCRRRRGYSQYGFAANDSATRYAKSSAWTYDVNQHDVLYGWSTTR